MPILDKQSLVAGETHHENRIIDLNTAELDQIADLPIGAGREPKLSFKHAHSTWDEVEQVPGLANAWQTSVSVGLVSDAGFVSAFGSESM